MASRWPHPMFFVAGVELAVGLVLMLLGITTVGTSLAIASGLLTVLASIAQIRTNHHGRKSHGRHRQAAEAYRAGASGGADNGTRPGASGGSLRTGAGVSGGAFYSHGSRPFLDEALRKALGMSVPAGMSVHTHPPVTDQDPAPRSRPAGDFNGASFAAGVVTGTRSFDVDKMGRLVGVAYAVVWTPGENQAKCMYRDDYAAVMYGHPRGGMREARRPEHSIADCEHGFYGYYEGSNDYFEVGRVMAVVEGYGETVIGTRGFRSSKARIVALHIPDDIGAGRRRLIERNYAGIPTFGSFDAMVAEFPPDDAGLGLNPTTDPNFWTREA